MQNNKEINIENKKISEEKLDKVSGGFKDDKYVNVTDDKSRYSDYNIPVDMYRGVKGKTYLFVSTNYWIFGELYNTYEADNGCFSLRTHDIIVRDAGGTVIEKGTNRMSVNKGGTFEVQGDCVQMYAKAGE